MQATAFLPYGLQSPASSLLIPGSSLLVVMPDFESGARRFDSCPRNFLRTHSLRHVSD